jgi:hypothetical protein
LPRGNPLFAFLRHYRLHVCGLCGEVAGFEPMIDQNFLNHDQRQLPSSMEVRNPPREFEAVNLLSIL